MSNWICVPTQTCFGVGYERIVVAIDRERRFEDGDGKPMIELEDGRSAWHDVVVCGGKSPTRIDTTRVGTAGARIFWRR
ncbi:MAG: hypothetical protein U9N46_13055 [Euryarchaeota archaeon]|nr:hypothetical protein [Euryarchaeota archaeon]